MKAPVRAVRPETIPLGEPTKLASARRPFGLWIILLLSTAILAHNMFRLYTEGCPTGINAEPCTAPQLLISNEVAVQVIGAVIAAIFVLKQISFSTFPLIGYSASRCSVAEAISARCAGSRYWKVTLSSNGSGTANICDAFYNVSRGEHKSPSNNLSYEKASELLAESGLTEYTDFLLWKVSPGSAISPGSHVTIFECVDELREEEGFAVDVVLVYSSRLGDLWAKRIRCIPDRSLPMAY